MLALFATPSCNHRLCLALVAVALFNSTAPRPGIAAEVSQAERYLPVQNGPSLVSTAASQASNAQPANAKAPALMQETPTLAAPPSVNQPQSVAPAHQPAAARPAVMPGYPQPTMPAALQPGLPPEQVLTAGDSRAALQVLRAFKADGWTSTDAKIFVQGVDAGTASGATAANGADEVSNVRRKELGFSEANNAATPQFLSLDQLSSAIDASRLSILKEFHCVAAYTRDFKVDSRQIFARVYAFSQPEGAYGAYYLLRQGASTVVQRGDGSSQDDQGISFWQGRLFISLRAGTEDDESSLIIKSLADKLSAVLKDHAGMPQIVNYLPFLMKVKGSERIVMGPLSARRFFPAPNIASLDLRSAVAAAAADYRIDSPPDRVKLLYVLYPNGPMALSAYTAYTNTFEGKAVSFQQPPIGESSMYKSNGTFVLCQQSGPRLTIIINAHKRASASLLANYLY